MEVVPGSVVSNGNGNLPPKGKGKPAAGEKARGAAKKSTGRKDHEKVAAGQRPKVVVERIDELVRLHKAAKDASEAASDAITKAAEDSGYLASTVKKLVTAKAGDKFEEKHREIEQQAELFDEVGGD